MLSNEVQSGKKSPGAGEFTPSGGTAMPGLSTASSPAGPVAGPLVIGLTVAVLTLLAYEWVLFALGIPLGMFFPIAALFVAQSVFNGVVMAGCVGEWRDAGLANHVTARQEALWQVIAVLTGALLALTGILPLAFARFSRGKPSEPAIALAIGGLLSAIVLALVVAPALYGLSVRRAGRGSQPSSTP